MVYSQKYLVGSLVFLSLLISLKTFAVADPVLPEGVCRQVTSIDSYGLPKCETETHKSTGAAYVDLNDDGIKELIFIHGDHSCGSMYWIFKLNQKAEWKYFGDFCGCEWSREGKSPYTVLNTKMHGFKVISTCGVSGFFNGSKYIGQMQ